MNIKLLDVHHHHHHHHLVEYWAMFSLKVSTRPISDPPKLLISFVLLINSDRV